MLSEKCQMQKVIYDIFHLQEMSRKGQYIRKESKLPGAEDGTGD